MLTHHRGVGLTMAKTREQYCLQRLKKPNKQVIKRCYDYKFQQKENCQGLGYKALHPSKSLVWNTLVPSNTEPRQRLKRRHISSYMHSLQPIAWPEGCISSCCPTCRQRFSSLTSSDWSPEGVFQSKSTRIMEILHASRTMAEESHERQAVSLLDG